MPARGPSVRNTAILMRSRFVLSEVATGLRRNLTMTVAMVLTTAISLGLLGGGLIVVQTIDEMQDLYYERIEIAIFLNDQISTHDPDCSSQTCAALLSDLKANPAVKSVSYESQQEAYARFQEIFAGQPELQKLTQPRDLPASLRVQLTDPRLFESVASQVRGRPGVTEIINQQKYLQELFNALTGVRNFVFVVAVILLLAVLMLIFNAIQLSAFTRRTEVSIMRLVGASRWYTQLPFLLEALIAGVVGALLAIGGLFLAKATVLQRVLGEVFASGILPRLTYGDIALISPILLAVGAVVAAVTGYVTLRLYVRT